jgi:preprotein translocase subunit SecE
VGSSPTARAKKSLITMKKITEFISLSYQEMTTKVSWPSGSDLNNQTILVLVASIIFALLIGIMDFGFEALMKVYYNL